MTKTTTVEIVVAMHKTTAVVAMTKTTGMKIMTGTTAVELHMTSLLKTCMQEQHSWL